MNRVHNLLCSSGWWRTRVEQKLSAPEVERSDGSSRFRARKAQELAAAAPSG